MKTTNNSEITFGNVRSIFYDKEKGKDQEFVDYLNSFSGEDIFQKFKTILKSWEFDVSPTLHLQLNKPIQLRIEYLLSEFPDDMGDSIVVNGDGCKCVVDIPRRFTLCSDIFPIYEVLSAVEVFGIHMNLQDLPKNERHQVIDNLPPKIYNFIVDTIVKDKSKILNFSNPVLKDLKLNFLTNDPYQFLQGLFSRYNKDYFRDVIYSLSKKIDGDILMNSTISDVEYYVHKFNEEVHENEKAGQAPPHL